MSAPRDDELLAQIMDLVRILSLRRWGRVPIYLRLTFPDGLEQQEIVPPATIHAATSAPLASSPSVPAAPAEDPWTVGHDVRHSDDFTRVFVRGVGDFRFAAKQAAVIAALWDAREDGAGERDQRALLTIAASDCTRLRDLFSRSPAWGTLVVQGMTPGNYRLCEMPENTSGNS